MSRLDFTVCLPAALVFASTLAAQPDPLYDCRRRAAVETNTSVNGIHAKQRGGLDNGNVGGRYRPKIRFREVEPVGDSDKG